MRGGGRAASSEWALRFLPEGPAWDLPFLRRFATGLASLPCGNAALLERIGESDPVVVPSSPAVSAVLGRAAAGLPGRLEFAVRPARCSGAKGRVGGFAILHPAVQPEFEDEGHRPGSLAFDRGDAGRPSRHLDQIEPAEPDLRDDQAFLGAPPPAVQSFWWATGGPSLAVRIRLAEFGERANSGSSLDVLAGAISQVLATDAGPVLLTRRSGNRIQWARWRRGRVAGLWVGRPFLVRPETAALAIRPKRLPAPFGEEALARHVVVLGASGSGKSTFVADLARTRIAAGQPTVIFDVHGDLGPRIAAGLPERARDSLVAVDVGRPEPEIPGVALFPESGTSERERTCAHIVASFRHLSSEGSEVYWGSRLEQLFDVFVRLVEEAGGGLPDLFDLLTDPARRDAARWATRRPPLARFLDELPALLRRHPDYLQPAAARVQKLLLQPKLLRLFEPTGTPIRIPELLTTSRSILWRVPAAELGPAGSRFATTLLASRTYLALAAQGASRAGVRVLLVFDEAQAIAPSLLAEILSEGRKFGVAAVVATQYADRLAPEALRASEGAAGTHLVFSVPRSGAMAAGRWLGLERAHAERLLPSLPIGVAVVDAALAGGAARLVRTDAPHPPESRAWEDCVARTLGEFGPSEGEGPGSAARDLDERVLLELFAMEGPGGVDCADPALVAARIHASGACSMVEALGRIRALETIGWVVRDGAKLVLSRAGARRLGIGSASGAPKESEEHRALLIEGFRVFARRGERLEFVRQGRFDARLPDGLVRQLPEDLARLPPAELAEKVARRGRTWLWTAFAGRDVHVEAEVTGAEKAYRIRHGLEKARDRKAAVIFLVSTARRAAKVRSVIHTLDAGVTEAQVWTLPRGADPNRHLDERHGAPTGRAGGPS
ncbi:MAG: DUF87 domain-containing protein [Thermoplasmata archaeon]|nr:DUF87 domain-containing protein [Thermoplasmata archaeon]